MNSTSPVARRSFLKLTAFSLGCGSLGSAFQSLCAKDKFASLALGYGPLLPVKDDATGIPLLELPQGFRYITYGWTGDKMTDGTTITPGAHDGTAVIAEADGIVTLCRNHELAAGNASFGSDRIKYDTNAGGGCSSLQFDTRQGKWLKSWPSLAGTIRNCAGGPTPWNSWLSCEETTDGPIEDSDDPNTHGWIFEVPAQGPATAQPLKGMGRFVHEAIAVDPDTGRVYETEDRGTAGFYRYTPKVQGKLAEGGMLHMLKVKGQPDLRKSGAVGQKFDCEWVPIEDPSKAHADPEKKDQLGCHSQGKAQGGTTFARLEGCWYGNNLIYFDATSGGPVNAGQIWQYDPKNEQLMALYTSPSHEILDQPDNLAVSPRGGIVLCEDGRITPQRLHGLTPDGKLFTFAKNNARLNGERNHFKGDFRGSEWTGANFSPDGEWLFVNLQTPGITFAITGPWGEGLL